MNLEIIINVLLALIIWSVVRSRRATVVPEYLSWLETGVAGSSPASGASRVDS